VLKISHHLVGVEAAGLRNARHELGEQRLLDALEHLLLHLPPYSASG